MIKGMALVKREDSPKITDEMVGSDELSSYCPTVVDKMIMAGEHEGGEEVTDELAGVNEVNNARCSARKYTKRAFTILIGFLHDFATGCPLGETNFSTFYSRG